MATSRIYLFRKNTVRLGWGNSARKRPRGGKNRRPGRCERRSWEQLNAHSEQLNATMCRQGTVLVAFTLTSHQEFCFFADGCDCKQLSPVSERGEFTSSEFINPFHCRSNSGGGRGIRTPERKSALKHPNDTVFSFSTHRTENFLSRETPDFIGFLYFLSTESFNHIGLQCSAATMDANSPTHAGAFGLTQRQTEYIKTAMISTDRIPPQTSPTTR